MATEIEKSAITVDGLNAYLARPVGGSASGMLLLPMITGIGAQVREWAEELAGQGVTALAWDPWRGRGSADDNDFDTLAEWMSQLDDEAALAEMHTLLDQLLGELGCTAVGTMGWCMGGRFALLLGSRESRLANVVAFHPTVPLPAAPWHTLDAYEAAAAIDAPTIMLYPGADDLVSRESFDRLQTALQSRTEAASMVHIHPRAEHGFTAKGRHANPVNKKAFDLSWPQVLAFVAATTRG